MESKSSLAQARETAGLTVEQISALTNIRVAVIKDLENNSVDICGGIAYARGHIRTITKVLNQKTPKSLSFDADLIVAEIEAAQSEDGRKIIERLAENNVADKPKEKKRMKFRTLASISAAVLSIGFVAQVAINNVSNNYVSNVYYGQAILNLLCHKKGISIGHTSPASIVVGKLKMAF